MTDALFLARFGDVARGSEILVDGDEGRHAVAVRRIRVGEQVFVADGDGTAIHGEVIEATKAGLRVRADDIFTSPVSPLRVVAVQALAKGDRAELAVETMTELGIDEIVPWRASRSVVRWDTGERGAKQLSRWQTTAREATKQSRRYCIPTVTDPVKTEQLCERIKAVDACYILHETAEKWLGETIIPTSGEIMFIIGPEGGISPEELDMFVAAGGQTVLVSDAVLRTSTAGVVALAQIQAAQISKETQA